MRDRTNGFIGLLSLPFMRSLMKLGLEHATGVAPRHPLFVRARSRLRMHRHCGLTSRQAALSSKSYSWRFCRLSSSGSREPVVHAFGSGAKRPRVVLLWPVWPHTCFQRDSDEERTGLDPVMARRWLAAVRWSFPC